MATEVVTTLSESKIALAQQTVNEIASSITTPVVQNNQFVFFSRSHRLSTGTHHE